MFTLRNWRWPVLLLLPVGVVAVFFQCGLLRFTYEAHTVLTRADGTKKTNKPLIAQGASPTAAVESAQRAAATFMNLDVAKQKAEIQRRLSGLEKRKSALSARLEALLQERRIAAKGAYRVRWTPEMAQRLQEMVYRRQQLVEQFPTHTDIPVLAKQIKSLDAERHGRVVVDPKRVSDLSQKIAEAQVESSLVARETLELNQSEKQLKPVWKIAQQAEKPRWPVRVPGWPQAAGTALGALTLGFFLIQRGSKSKHEAKFTNGLFRVEPAFLGKIPLELVSTNEAEGGEQTANVLPDDPLSRKASSLYEQWLALVKMLYTPGDEPPQGLHAEAEPLLKDTIAFLPGGQDAMARHLARVVAPEDLPAHVTRTVLMALMGAHEAGASPEHRQGMTYAALLHDLAVAPRADNAWHEIGAEVGRLSFGLVRKIPGLPAPLVAMIEGILVGMDEYPQAMWQNVPRQEDLDSFASLLRQIDRFDKVMQKQKSRLTRRMIHSAAN